MGGLCAENNKAINDAIQKQLKAYEDESMLAVDQLIGRPSEAHINIAETKREIKIEKNNYKYHVLLHDLLVNFLMENGEVAFRSGSYIDPYIAIDNWYNLLQYKFGWAVTPHSIQLSPKRPKSAYFYVKKILEITTSKKGMTPEEIAMMPPSLAAIRADRFGIASKIIRATQRATDNARQAYSGFETEFDMVRTGVSNNIRAMITNGAVTVSNSSMDGLEGFRDRDLKSLTIIKEDDRSYTVIYDDDLDRKRVKIKKSDVLLSGEDVKEALVSKYRDELLNDLEHGQVRYIIPKFVPTNTKSRKKWLKTDNGKAVADKLDRMKFYGENDMPSPDVRNVPYKGKVYSYVLVKQGELSKGEEYHAYLIQIEDIDGTITKDHIDTGYDMPEFNEVLKEGFYKSNSKEYMTPVLTKRKRFIKDSADKRWRKFRYMQRQPNKYIMDSVVSEAPERKLLYNTLWEELLTYRDINKRMGMDVFDRIDSEQNVANKILKRLKANFGARGDLSKEQVEGLLQELMNLTGTDSRAIISKDGTLHSANSFFTLKGENYGPVIYYRKELDTFIDTTLSNMRERKEEMWDEMTAEERTALKEDIEQMEEYAELVAGLSEDSTDNYKGRLIFLQRAVHTKHRVKFTDEAARRKDDRVHTDYLERTYRTLERNSVVNELIVGLEHLSRINQDANLFMDESKWLINRVKISIGDPDVHAGWRISWGNQEVANFMNSIKSLTRMEQEWDAGKAEKAILSITSFITAKLLTSKPALNNRTQTVNDGIRGGFKIMFKAHRQYTSPYWQAVINHTGGLQQVSMFQDIMLAGQDVKWTDAGIVTHPLIGVLTAGITKTIPTTNMVNYVRIWRYGRDKFIDGALKKQGPEDIKKIYEFLLRLARESEGLERKDLEYLAENYWDLLFHTKSESNEKFIRARFKNLVGVVNETRMKRMVSWTLSWHWKPFKELMTFTGGEKVNRSVSIVSALMLADEMGALGASSATTSVEHPTDGGEMKVHDRFFSDTAVNIARNAVYNSQFGMNQVYLPEAFGGIGRIGGQFKAYPYFQVLHDHNLFSALVRGSQGHGFVAGLGDATWRLTSEASRSGFNWIKVGLGDETKKYSPGQKGPDHEARAVLRLLSTRMMASVFAPLLEVIPGWGYSMRLLLGTTAMGTIRGAENPIAAVFARLILLSILLQGDYDDDDDRSWAYDDILRLIIPVLASVIWQAINNYMEMEEEGDWPSWKLPG